MTLVKLTVLLILLYLETISTGTSPYCSLHSCGSRKHTKCEYASNKVACEGDANKIHVGLTQEERAHLLDEHNKLRSKVASGQTKFPKASNMMKLRWDKEIEHIAQRWALQCKFGHDDCRNTLKNEEVGQNAAMQAWDPSAPNDRKQTITEAVGGLYSEEEYMDPAGIASFQPAGAGGHAVGHFTQLVWAKTDRLGCGAIDFPEDPWQKFHLFCNYLTSGNFMGQPIYKEGEPCSDCPEGTICSTVYDGLCTAPEFDNKNVPSSDKEDDEAGKGGGAYRRNLKVMVLQEIFVIGAVFLVW